MVYLIRRQNVWPSDERERYEWWTGYEWTSDRLRARPYTHDTASAIVAAHRYYAPTHVICHDLVALL